MGDYRNWFDHGGHWYKSDADINLRCYVQDPRKIEDAKRIAWLDETAGRMIRDAESTIEALREYRQALAARYAELDAMPYTLKIRLERHKGWNGPVNYFLRLIRVYADGHTADEECTKYPGTERHKAISDYKELVKSRPGITAEIDIQKGKWER